jgi:hypothetical protein
MGSSMMTARLNEISDCLNKGITPVVIIGEYVEKWKKSSSTIKRYIALAKKTKTVENDLPLHILSNEEVEENLSDIIRDKSVSHKDRINATNTLIKIRDLELKMKKGAISIKKSELK